MTQPEADQPAPQPISLTIVTGMSGAGRSTAANALEDLGWFVVDNLPPALLPRLVELGVRTKGSVSNLAAVVDVRGGAFFESLREALAELETRGVALRIVYLEASDDVLVRRFENVRRPHPLQESGRITDGIAAERALLRDLRGRADHVIDTSDKNVHQLREQIANAFRNGQGDALSMNVVSFGYKHGLPVDADLVVDCRFLPNPHWVPELRPRTGLDPEVSAYVLAQPGAREFVDGYADLLGPVLAGFRREGKRYVTLAVGCTGGKHRSVAVAEQLGARLTADGVAARVVHRDVGRE
ncbi:MAG: RNase adapter RapZ [Sporichthyaceae bacterium]